jgi:hypothetical protein
MIQWHTGGDFNDADFPYRMMVESMNEGAVTLILELASFATPVTLPSGSMQQRRFAPWRPS